MKKIIIINKIVIFLIFKYCLFFNFESKSALNVLNKLLVFIFNKLDISRIGKDRKGTHVRSRKKCPLLTVVDAFNNLEDFNLESKSTLKLL